MSSTITSGCSSCGRNHQRAAVIDLADDVTLTGQQLLERADQQRVIVRKQDPRPHKNFLLPVRTIGHPLIGELSADQSTVQTEPYRALCGFGTAVAWRRNFGIERHRDGRLQPRAGAGLGMNLERAAHGLEPLVHADEPEALAPRRVDIESRRRRRRWSA